MVLWFCEHYYYYTICIFVISTGSIVVSLYDMITNNENIRKMALYSCKVNLMEPNKKTKQVYSEQLVPGDIIEIPERASLPCDLILLSGSCIVNEAMLTGESIPVMKASLPVSSLDIYSEKTASKYTLYGGTSVI